MEISDFMKIFASGRRMEVLEALLKGRTKDEIKASVPASTFAFTVDYLKKVNFATEKDGEVVLTESGRAYLIVFDHFIRSITTLQRIFRAFPDHIIFFPDDFYIRLYEISDFELVASEPSDVLKPHRVFFEYLMQSSDIQGVTPMLFPDYPQMLKELVTNDIPISIVITEDLRDVVLSDVLDEQIVKTPGNVNIFTTDQKPKIAITVTDAFLSIGFFYKSGSYDFTRDLFCTSAEALKFGMDLVDYYRNTARKMV
jgi:predicted transcriptional regulator